MNAKATRKVLNSAFKQFQRLPDWPLAQNSGVRRPGEMWGNAKGPALLRTNVPTTTAFRAQTIAG
jgi:hypothetical protein